MQPRYYLQALGTVVPLFASTTLGIISVTSLQTWSPSGRPGTSPDWYIHVNITDPDPTKTVSDPSGPHVYCEVVWQYPAAPYNETIECNITDATGFVNWAWTVTLLEANDPDPWPTTNFDLLWRAVNLSQSNEPVIVWSGIGQFEVAKNLQGTCAGSGFCSWSLKPEDTPYVVEVTSEKCWGTWYEALRGFGCGK